MTAKNEPTVQQPVTVESQLARYPRSLPKFLILFGTIAVLYFLTDYIMVFKGVNDMGITLAHNAFYGIFHPNWSKIFTLSNIGVPYLLLETFAIAFLGTLIGTLIALPFAFFSARNITNNTCAMIGLSIISVIRAFPSFLWGMLFVKIVGTGPFAGVLAMSIGSVGMLTKLLVEAIEDMDSGVLEALDASGCTTFQKIRYGILPQLSSGIISTIIYRLDINVKNAAILGVVAAGGIGSELIMSINGRRWTDTGAYLLGIVVLVLVLEYFSTRIRKRLAASNN
jgi:phosphonate transport system permease protein